MASKLNVESDCDDDDTMMHFDENSKQTNASQGHSQKLITSTQAKEPVSLPLVLDQSPSILDPTNTYRENARDLRTRGVGTPATYS